MSFNVKTISVFERQAKRLIKKFPSLKKEIQTLILELQDKPTKGTSIGKDCYKIRLAIASKGKGKSGGAIYGNVVGSSFEYGYCFKKGRTYSNSILGSKTYDQAIYEGIISSGFSLKIHGLDNLTKNAPRASSFLYDLPNQFANYGIQSK